VDIKTQKSEEPLDSPTLSPERGSRYEAVIHATQEGVLVINESGIIQTFNPAAESLFGYQAEEVIGKNVSLLIPEPHRSEHDNYIQQYLRTGKSDLIGMVRELTALRKDGSTFSIELAANPINLDTQRFFVGTVRDITKRKQAEVQQNLLHNLTKIFSTSDDLESVFPKALQTVCNFMNWEIIFYWISNKEKQTLHCSHSWHAPEDTEKFKEFVDKSIEITFENGIGLPGRVCESGKTHWVVDVTQDANFPRFPFARKAGLHSGFGFPVTNSTGIIGVVEVFSEKTLQPKEDMAQLIGSLGNQMGQFLERCELKLRLSKDQQNFFNMLNNLPVAFHLQAPDYTVPFANKMFRERFGAPQEDKKCFQLMHNKSEPCEICTPFEIFETNETRDSVWTALDGRTYLTVVTPFQDIDGSNLVMEMAVDITKEKAAEIKLERTNEELRDFVHIASHDLQEPLRKIISFGDLIRSRSKTIDEKDIYYLNRMEHSSLRLQNLVEDLVNYSTLDSAQARKVEQLDLNDVVQQVLMDLEIAIEQSKAKVNIVDLPVIEANKFQIFHLFQNLVSNALKYHREEEPPSLTIIRKTVASRKGYCRIDIADNGIGFEEKYLDRIFKPFQRLHASSEFEGTGMGLTICKKIIDNHNGTITAEANPPNGTTFIIELPVKQDKEDGYKL
jgi:PAS domain S-box-containing protein